MLMTTFGGGPLQVSSGKIEFQVFAPGQDHVTVQSCSEFGNWSDQTVLNNGQIFSQNLLSGSRFYRLRF
jgi:hypothetical protein